MSFDLHRIRAGRYDVFLTVNDLKDAAGNDLATALRGIDRISRYETRAFVESAGSNAHQATKCRRHCSRLKMGAACTLDEENNILDLNVLQKDRRKTSAG
jgi:hypothetical protein